MSTHAGGGVSDGLQHPVQGRRKDQSYRDQRRMQNQYRHQLRAKRLLAGLVPQQPLRGKGAQAAAEESQATDDIANHLARILNGIEGNVGHLQSAHQRTVGLTQVADELRELIAYFRFKQG